MLRVSVIKCGWKQGLISTPSSTCTVHVIRPTCIRYITLRLSTVMKAVETWTVLTENKKEAE